MATNLNDPGNCVCLRCKHIYVDEPDTNKTLQQDYNALMRKHYEAAEKAKAEANKNGTAVKKTKPPEKPKPHVLWHCSQMRCVSVGISFGTSCPIDCKDDDGHPYGADVRGNCACPICKCQCKLSCTTDASQDLRIGDMLEADTVRKKETIELQASRSLFSDIIKKSADNAVASAVASKKMIPPDTLRSIAGTNAARSMVREMDPQQHKAFFRAARKEIGKPTTLVKLPVALQVNGVTIEKFDTRGITSRKNHRKKNNRLIDLEGEDEPAGMPLKPYEGAYEIMETNAEEEKLIDFNGDFDEAEALDAALIESQEDLQPVTPTPSRAPVQAPVVITINTPDGGQLTPQRPTAPSTGSTPLLDRVSKHSFKRSLETEEVIDIDDPLGSPDIVAKSPYSHQIYARLNNQNSGLSNYVRAYHEAMPLADSQEGHHAARCHHIETTPGEKKKKKKKKRRKNIAEEEEI